MNIFNTKLIKKFVRNIQLITVFSKKLKIRDNPHPSFLTRNGKKKVQRLNGYGSSGLRYSLLLSEKIIYYDITNKFVVE